MYNEKLPNKIIKASWNYFFDSRKTYSVFWHSLCEIWNYIFPINLPSCTLITGDQACGGKKKKKIKKTEENMDFLPSELPVWIALQGQGNKGNKSICYLHISKAGLWNPLPLTGMRSPWWRWHHQVGRDSQQCLCDEIFFTRAPSSNEIRDISAAMAFLVWSHTSLC